MRFSLLTLLLSLSLCSLSAQLISFRIVHIDTQEHSALDAFAGEHVIGNSNVFRDVFSNYKYDVKHPSFRHTIYLKRTIQGNCLQNISNSVTMDSLNQTITWLSTIERGVCEESNTRHIVIAISRPPMGYDIQFDTNWVDNQALTTGQYISDVQLNPISCKLEDVAGGAFFPVPAVIDNDSLYLRYTIGEALSCNAVDFSSSLILANIYGGDCHMQLRPHPYFDPVTNTLVLQVYNIWGRCRAGGRKPLAVVATRPQQQSFKVVFEEIQVDSWAEYHALIKGEE